MRWIAVALLLLTTLVAQDHAPTLKQCQADQKLWWEQLDSGSDEISTLTVTKLNQRSDEMTKCGVVDTDRIAAYDRTAASLQLAVQKAPLEFCAKTPPHGAIHC
jgi:hypothetical protein